MVPSSCRPQRQQRTTTTNYLFVVLVLFIFFDKTHGDSSGWIRGTTTTYNSNNVPDELREAAASEWNGEFKDNERLIVPSPSSNDSYDDDCQGEAMYDNEDCIKRLRQQEQQQEPQRKERQPKALQHPNQQRHRHSPRYAPVGIVKEHSQDVIDDQLRILQHLQQQQQYQQQDQSTNDDDDHSMEIMTYYDHVARRTIESCLTGVASYNLHSTKQPELTVIQYYFAVESSPFVSVDRRAIQKLETNLFHLISDKVMWCTKSNGAMILSITSGGGRRQLRRNHSQQERRQARALQRARQLDVLMVNAAPNDLKTTLPCAFDDPPPQSGQNCAVYVGQMAILATESSGVDEVVDAILDAVKESMDKGELIDPSSLPGITNVRWLGVTLQEEFLDFADQDSNNDGGSGTTDPFFSPAFDFDGISDGDSNPNNGEGYGDQGNIPDDDSEADSGNKGDAGDGIHDQFGDPEDWANLIGNLDGSDGEELPILVGNPDQSDNAEGSEPEDGEGSDGSTVDDDKNQNDINDIGEENPTGDYSQGNIKNEETFDSTVGNGKGKKEDDNSKPVVEPEESSNNGLVAGQSTNDFEGNHPVGDDETVGTDVLGQDGTDGVSGSPNGGQNNVVEAPGGSDGENQDHEGGDDGTYESSGSDNSINGDLGNSQNGETDPFHSTNSGQDSTNSDPTPENYNEGDTDENQLEGKGTDSEGGEYLNEDLDQDLGEDYDWLEDSTQGNDEDEVIAPDDGQSDILNGGFSNNSSGAVFLAVSLIPVAFAGGLVFVFFRKSRESSDNSYISTYTDLPSPFVGTGDPPGSVHDGHYHYTEGGRRYLSTTCEYCAETRRHGFFTEPCLSTIREGSGSLGASTDLSPSSSITSWEGNGTVGYGEPSVTMSSSYEMDQLEGIEISPKTETNSYYQLMAKAYGTASPSAKPTPLKNNLSRTRPPSHQLEIRDQNDILSMNYDDPKHKYDEPLKRPISPSDASTSLSYHSGLLSSSSSGSTDEDDVGNVNARLLGAFETEVNKSPKHMVDEIKDLIDIPDTLNEFTDRPVIAATPSPRSMSHQLDILLSDTPNSERDNNPRTPSSNGGASISTGMYSPSQIGSTKSNDAGSSVASSMASGGWNVFMVDQMEHDEEMEHTKPINKGYDPPGKKSSPQIQVDEVESSSINNDDSNKYAEFDPYRTPPTSTRSQK